METTANWAQPFFNAMSSVWENTISFLPNLIAAIALLIIGFFVAKALNILISRILASVGFNSLGVKTGVSQVLERSGITSKLSDLTGKFIFWIIFLTFLVSSAEILGLDRVSDTIDQLIKYLPKVVGAGFVLIVGLFLGNLIKDLIEGSAETIGIEYTKPLGNLVFSVICIIVISLAINQLEIETDLLNLIISILIGALALAIAISLGLGTRDLSKNVVASVYARDLFKVGDRVKYEKIEGSIVQVGAVKTLVRLKDGSITTIPNNALITSTINTRND
ncbi:hypothetical protein NBRC116493_16520 [Aurantivibrio infirmus]